MTKKNLATSALLTANAFLAFTPLSVVHAGNDINLRINTPRSGINPNANEGQVIANIITIVFVVAALVVLFFLILGAFNWITSGGDKDKVGKARGTILNALIGLAILALAFLIARVAGRIVNVDITNLTLPTLDSGAV